MSNKIIFVVVLLAFLAGFTSSQTVQPPFSTPPSPIASSRQVLLVTTANWDAVPGTMRRFARTNDTAPWVQVGDAVPVVVGRNGLAWGRGINPQVNDSGPTKKEGDGKSPAGIFRLSAAFGLVEPDKIKPLKLPYQYLSSGIECVDDVKSGSYNSIVDRSKVARPDWDSSEKMQTIAQYRLGVVVEHNTDPREPGGGSCIFIHIWKDANTGTSGCTAMTGQNIDAIVPWLDPAEQPVLVQLPEAEYEHLKKKWRLP